MGGVKGVPRDGVLDKVIVDHIEKKVAEFASEFGEAPDVGEAAKHFREKLHTLTICSQIELVGFGISLVPTAELKFLRKLGDAVEDFAFATKRAGVCMDDMIEARFPSWPTLDEVKQGNPVQIVRWLRLLPSPTEDAHIEIIRAVMERFNGIPTDQRVAASKEVGI